LTKNKRSSSRIAAIQALFQIVSNTSDAQTVIREFIEFRFNKYNKTYEGVSKDTEFFNILVQGTHENIHSIDIYISKHLLEGWKISRMNSAMVSLLRAATFELINLREIPVGVVIDEYVSIASLFFNKSEVNFANKILDSLAKEIRCDKG